MKTIVGALLVVLCSSAMASPPLAEKPVYRAVRAARAPVIDGDLSDPCWQEAAKLDRWVDVLYSTPVKDQTIGYFSVALATSCRTRRRLLECNAMRKRDGASSGNTRESCKSVANGKNRRTLRSSTAMVVIDNATMTNVRSTTLTM